MTVDGDGDGGEGDATNVRFTAAFSGHCPYFLLLLLLLLLLFIIISSLIKRAIEIQSNEAIQGPREIRFAWCIPANQSTAFTEAFHFGRVSPAAYRSSSSKSVNHCFIIISLFSFYPHVSGPFI